VEDQGLRHDFHDPGEMMASRARAGWWVVATALVAGSLSGGLPASATEMEMAKLPVTQPNLCYACHLQQSPVPGDAGLNPFGLDFLSGGRIWDQDLASQDSDGDGCLNGVEVGDSDGDGRADGNINEQTGNPGVVDECGSGSLVDEKLWGTLKAMFDGRR